MTTDERFNLITRNLAEVLTEEDLRHLLDSDTPLRHYIGFEVSGKLHIGHFFQLMKVKDIQEAGGETIIWLADLHSAINDKLGGDLDVIKRVSYEYFIPAMESLFESIGGDPKKLIFKLCSQGYAEHPEFWFTFLEMAKGTSLARSKRSITIMGREEAEDSIETAKVIYPIMQAADIFLLQTNIAQAGMDQRKVHVVARDSAMQIKTNPLKDSQGKQVKPVAIHTPILLSLLFQPAEMIKIKSSGDEKLFPKEVINNEETVQFNGLSIKFFNSLTHVKVAVSYLGIPSGPTTIQFGNSILSIPTSATGTFEDSSNSNIFEDTSNDMRIKMSKSKADSGITVHDSAEDIKKKINSAFALEGSGNSTNNPILNWTRYLIFNEPDASLTINRPAKWGGDMTFNSYADLEKAYSEKQLHPMDLKNAVADWLIKTLEPVKKHFEDPKRKAALEEIEKLTTKI